MQERESNLLKMEVHTGEESAGELTEESHPGSPEHGYLYLPGSGFGNIPL